jgi:NACHT conflict system protein
VRSRGLSFADAVKLLGGDSQAVNRLGDLAGVAAGAVTVASAGTVDFFALRDQLVKWGQSTVRAWHDKVQGLSRYDRTDRLIAAHSIIVIISLLEVLKAEESQDARRSARYPGARHRSSAELVAGLLSLPVPVPTPPDSFEKFESALRDYYVREVSWGRVDHDVVDRVVRRYTEYYRQLAAEIPEFRLWAEMGSDEATRELVREAIGALGEQRAAVTGVRAGLSRVYEATLEKPILRATDAPRDAILPTLRKGYVDPTGRISTAGPEDLPATELWWENSEELADVQAFVLSWLTSARATDGLLVLLGHPGSGKSVLTRILAARLTWADFLPIRVELRTVRADSRIQMQIEEALYLLLGETVSWPDVVRAAGSALPVVMLDGFDELLQATGQNWADYLEQIQEFQQREADLGRPLAVIVTSRTVVADRARFPRDTPVVRLNSFSEPQIRSWLDIWNAVNRAQLTARGLRELTAGAVLAHAELAEQPLLLLLLALYDNRDNELQRQAGGLARVELYERLFTDFFERQVDKFGTRMPPAKRLAEVAAEWRRLSAVAVSMHNRGRDAILEAELEDDLRRLLHPDDWSPGVPALPNLPLSASQMLVGRFFFIHESQASRDTNVAERSYEFLHATFGEFLTARQLVEALTELAEDRANLRRGRVLDAGYLYALTSYATVTRRTPVWEFCQGLITRLDGSVRRDCLALVLDLLVDAGEPHPSWTYSEYRPEHRTPTARHATYSANLVCLAVLLSDGPVTVGSLVGEPVVQNWRRQALLWMSQLEPEDARRLWQALRVEWRLDLDERMAQEPAEAELLDAVLNQAPDDRYSDLMPRQRQAERRRRITEVRAAFESSAQRWFEAELRIRVEDAASVGVLTSLPWPPDDVPGWTRTLAEDISLPADSPTGRMLRKSAFVQTGFDTRELIYVLVPFWRRFGDIHHADQWRWRSDARAVFEVFENSFTAADLRGLAEAYRDLLGSSQSSMRIRGAARDHLVRQVWATDPENSQRFAREFLKAHETSGSELPSDVLQELDWPHGYPQDRDLPDAGR